MTGQEVIDWIKEHHAENEIIYVDCGGNVCESEEMHYTSNQHWKNPREIIIIE